MNNNPKDRDRFKKEFARRVHKFILELIKFIDSLEKNDPTCRIIGNDQLLRSGTSIGGNYFEGQSAGTSKELARYFTMSLKSGNESKYWLILLRDSGKCDKNKANYLLKELIEICNVLATSVKTLKNKF
ncbi:MAG: four helix bundle protein [Patescibacteria group bacterium]|nr:four helix bundle protein [Patescibacteria group bacterium]MDD4610953.1 four helix bundle protein [Patescibacteria group bacterium]